MNREWRCLVCGYIYEGETLPDACPACGALQSKLVLNEPLPDTLEKTLKKVFSDESKAFVRNLAFAKKAKEEELPQIAELFRAVAEAERVHAAEFLKYLKGTIGDTEENLKASFENEIKASVQIYPLLIKEALDLNREDVAMSLSRVRDVEERHSKLYKEALSAMMTEEERDYNVCQICGYVFNGRLPDTCPVCKATKDNFKKTI